MGAAWAMVPVQAVRPFGVISVADSPTTGRPARRRAIRPAHGCVLTGVPDTPRTAAEIPRRTGRSCAAPRPVGAPERPCDLVFQHLNDTERRLHHATEAAAGHKLARVTRCPRCGNENRADARFCNECGASLAPAGGQREERKVVTIVFADLVGSTARAESLDPEDVRAILSPYHARLRHELERYGGTVEKFIGDAVVGVFGAPVAHEDDAERAVRAALAIQEAIAELNEEDPVLALEVRIGVNTGEALVALDARPELGEAMVSGDVINTCARVQGAAPPGRSARRPPDAQGDRAGDRLRGARGRERQGQDRAGSRLAGGRAACGLRHRARRHGQGAARRAGARAHAPHRRPRPGAQRRASPARDPGRRAGHRQEPARPRALAAGRRRQRPHRLAARTLAALRRGHRLLGARRDRQGAGRHPRIQRRPRGRGEAARTASQRSCPTEARPPGSSATCALSPVSRSTRRRPPARRRSPPAAASSRRSPRAARPSSSSRTSTGPTTTCSTSSTSSPTGSTRCHFSSSAPPARSSCHGVRGGEGARRTPPRLRSNSSPTRTPPGCSAPCSTARCFPRRRRRRCCGGPAEFRSSPRSTRA